MTWPDVYVEAAFGESPSDQLSSYTWVDISSRVSALSIKSPKRSRFIDRFAPGRVTITADNSDRALDPFATSGTYTSGGESQVRPNLPLRVRVVYSGTTYYLGVWYLDQVTVNWRDPSDGDVVISGTDAFKLLAKRNPSDTVFAEQLTGARIDALLDAADWPSADRDVSAGLSRLAPITVADDARVLDLLHDVVDHEHGLLYVDVDGQVRFEDRAWPWTSTTWTFTDAGSSDYDEVYPRTDEVTVINKATAANSGGLAYTATNSTSASKYGISAWSKSDYVYATEPEYADWPSALVSLYGAQINRFARLDFDPSSDTTDAKWVRTLSAQLGERVSITRTPPGGGSAITRVSFIDGIEHSIRAVKGSTQGVWLVSWDLSDATSFPTWTPAGWDSAVWDTAKWFY